MSDAAGAEREFSKKVYEDFIYLTGCAVRQAVPDKEHIEQTDLEAVYTLAKKHLLAAAVGMALEAAGKKTKEFSQAIASAQRKNALLDADRKNILAELDRAGIWYMPLKGAALKDLYPRYGMREMADNDILYDATRAADVKEIMKQAGFTPVTFDRGAHDVYQKKPVSNFEMHRMLFHKNYMDRLSEYYKNVKQERLIADGGGGCGYHFSDDDFYIYMVAHEYKHFIHKGTGLRSLADTYVYLKNRKLNMDRVALETEKMGIREYEEQNRGLAQRLFDGEELTEADREMLEYILGSGVYGDYKKNVRRLIRENGRGAFLRGRLFPSLQTMQRLYPALRKAPALYPFFNIWRLIKVFFRSNEKSMYELKAAMGLNKEAAEEKTQKGKETR